jgi:hypothetical protein
MTFLLLLTSVGIAVSAIEELSDGDEDDDGLGSDDDEESIEESDNEDSANYGSNEDSDN